MKLMDKSNTRAKRRVEKSECSSNTRAKRRVEKSECSSNTRAKRRVEKSECSSNKIYFIGIGGIGASALAKYYLKKGYQVSGSDLVPSEITKALLKLGAKVFSGSHKAKNLSKNTDLVIYSPAVQSKNPELKKAKKLGIKCQSYPEALGELTKKYFTIAVSGTHGKSTTTAMIGLLLTKAGLDPTVIVGTKLKEFGDSNCRIGKSEYLVIEADEHFASFLNYWPKIIVLTNLEADHLDYYKNLKNYISAFKKFIYQASVGSEDEEENVVLFASHLPEKGTLVANKDDENILKLTKNTKQRTEFYSLKQKESEKIREILKIPGEHNVSNALATLKVARILKIPDKVSFKALSEYKGSWRRFEIIKEKPFVVISDYAHHPTEIKATLEGAREKYLYPPKFSKGKLRQARNKIWLVYQPHQYQRTFYLFKDFVRVFRQAPIDKIIITDIFDVAGREDREIKKKVNSEKLVEAIKKPNVIYLPKSKILNYLKKNLRGGPPDGEAKEVVIIMGAGNIYLLTNSFK